jgi:hypothetical protein
MASTASAWHKATGEVSAAAIEVMTTLNAAAVKGPAEVLQGGIAIRTVRG